MSIWLVGAGAMAQDYAKILKTLDENFEVIGRGNKSASSFEKATEIDVNRGGLNSSLQKKSAPEIAIVAVGVEELAQTASNLIHAGTKHLLVEKPGGLDTREILNLNKTAKARGVNVWLAYNRRFHASTIKLEEMIAIDGGATSVIFEFTEWSHTISDVVKAPGIKENWFLNNSTHVVDLVFHLCGLPADWKHWHDGALDWHPSAARFCGAGITERGILFSYLADWEAPGRWGIEVLTRKRRMILRPMEKLFVTPLHSINVEPIEINYNLDNQYKPGLYLQTEAFLKGNMKRFCSLAEQVRRSKIYSEMAGY